MLMKLKVLAAMAAAMTLECVSPNLPHTVPHDGTGTSTQGLTIAVLPPRPVSAVTRGWERGVSTGLGTSNAQSVYVAMYKDPSLNGRFFAFGYDVAGQRSLFVFSVALIDELNFRNQLTIDLGQWKQSRGTAPGEDGITDGVGGTLPPPRPQLDDMMWKHVFYHSSIQEQIEQEGPNGGTTTNGG